MLAGCALDVPQSTFVVNGPVAREQLELFMITFWWAMLVLVLVAAAMIYILWRYRQRPDDDGSLPPQIHGNTLIEILWTIFPLVILTFIAVPTVQTILRLNEDLILEETEVPGAAAESQALEVIVTGFQWWWEFEYPELGVVTANELHIPTDTQVILRLRSGDVIHSFWVPRLAGKRDLIPSQINSMWLEASEPGIYSGQCAELCLGPHAYMRFRVIADAPQDFERWVESFQQADTQQVAAQVSEGAQLFQQKGCAGCHAIAGVAQGQVGPDLTNFGLRHTVGAGVLPNTPENLARWIRDPQEVKPGNYMPDLGLLDEEIDALVAYLESLGTTAAQASLGGQHGR